MAKAKYSGMSADSQVSRRNLLTAAPVAALTAALCAGDVAAATGAALTETPVMAMFREWKKRTANEMRVYADDTTGDGDSPECLAATDAVKGIEHQMLAVPSVSAQDFVLKMLVLTGDGQWGAPSRYTAPQLWAEARALVGEV